MKREETLAYLLETGQLECPYEIRESDRGRYISPSLGRVLKQDIGKILIIEDGIAALTTAKEGAA